MYVSKVESLDVDDGVRHPNEIRNRDGARTDVFRNWKAKFGKWVTITLGAAVISLPGVSLAGEGTMEEKLESDQVRAEIVDVDPLNSKLRVRVVETGDSQMAEQGKVYEFVTSDEVDIQFPYGHKSIVTPLNPTLEDLNAGDKVRLELAQADQAFIIIGVFGSPDA